MVLTSDKERVKSLIQDTLSLLCRNGLNFNKQFCIEALVGVTIDEDDVFLVNIKETVKSDKAIEEERLAEEAARLAEEVRQRQEEDRANTSSPSQSVSSTSYSVKHAQRKRQRDSAANESDTVDSDMFDSYSEPSEKRSFMEAGNVKRERLEQEDEDELVFVKEEPREDNSFQDQYGGHPGPSWNNPLPPVSQYNTQSSSHDMLQHPPLPPGAGDMQYPQTQGSRRFRLLYRKKYTEQDLEEAVKMVLDPHKTLSNKAIASRFGIPTTTLFDHVQRAKKRNLVNAENSSLLGRSMLEANDISAEDASNNTKSEWETPVNERPRPFETFGNEMPVEIPDSPTAFSNELSDLRSELETAAKEMTRALESPTNVVSDEAILKLEAPSNGSEWPELN